MKELRQKVLSLCLTKDDLLMEAEMLERYGEYLHISFIGYTAKELREVANTISSVN